MDQIGSDRVDRGGAGGWEALRRLATLQPAAFGTATLLIAQAGVYALFAGGLVIWGKSALFAPARGVGSDVPEGWREDGAHPRARKAAVAGGVQEDGKVRMTEGRSRIRPRFAARLSSAIRTLPSSCGMRAD